jgi:hypothetical protein
MGTAVRRSLLALVLLGLAASCGSDDNECHQPADCVTVPVADSCKQIGKRGVCVLGCAVVNGTDSCPAPYTCTGKADDGSPFCKGPK